VGGNSLEREGYRSLLDLSRTLLRIVAVIGVALSSILIDGLVSQGTSAAASTDASAPVSESVASGKSSSPTQSRQPMISICVGIGTSLLRDPGTGGCRPNMEFSIRWGASSVAPQMCISRATRYLSLATAGRCLLEGTVAAKPNRSNKFFACAHGTTGLLRWPITGRCLATNNPVRYLAAPLEPEVSATTTLTPETTTTTTSTTTTTVPAPVYYSPPTGTTATTSTTPATPPAKSATLWYRPTASAWATSRTPATAPATCLTPGSAPVRLRVLGSLPRTSSTP
jgi:hypothetical protein